MVRRTILELVPATGTNDEDLLFLRQGGEDKRLTVETLRDDLQPDLPDGTETQRGLVRFASESEAQTGIGDDSAVTPAGLESKTATTTRRGIVELATNAETVTGTSSTLAVTPVGLESKTATTTRRGIIELASNAEVISGQDTTKAVTPAGLEARIRNFAGGGIGSYVLGIVPTNRGDGVEFTVSSGTQFPGGGIQTIEPLRDSLTPYVRPNELMGTWVYIGPTVVTVGSVLLSGLFYRIA